MSGHTETPWQSTGTPVLANKLSHYAMITSEQNHVATIINLPEAEANAAFIVTAVNAHEKLVAMLERFATEGPYGDDLRLLIRGIGGVTPAAESAMKIADAVDERQEAAAALLRTVRGE